MKFVRSTVSLVHTTVVSLEIGAKTCMSGGGNGFINDRHRSGNKYPCADSNYFRPRVGFLLSICRENLTHVCCYNVLLTLPGNRNMVIKTLVSSTSSKGGTLSSGSVFMSRL